MFSQDIVSSDSFLDMPTSSRELYFQLGMYADDDGFVSPQKIVRMIGANADDLKVLLAKGFLLQFENKVVVVRHWKQNNFIRSDRYHATMYASEFNSLTCINGVYTLDTSGIPRVDRGREVGREVGKVIPSHSLEEIKRKAFGLSDKLKP
jgi:hypothetical protein